MTDSIRTELLDLLEALCEDRITSEEHARVEGLVLSDSEARRLYLEYVGLHGMLYWDAAAAARVPTTEATTASQPAHATSGRRRRFAILSTAAACLVATIALLLSLPDDESQLAATSDPGGPGIVEDPAPVENDEESIVAFPPIQLDPGATIDTPDPRATGTPGTTLVENTDPDNGISDAELVAFIDDQISAVWSETDIEPAPVADDAEWLRRAYLDLAGHIPSPAAAEQFLASNASNRRVELVNRLLDDPDYSRHFATVWTNQLVGRTPEQPIDRPGLEEFLRGQFADNHGWDATVTELIAAEGTSHDSGAANFLLAHLNNEAVPATAVTARVFLGMQVQCTQCHKHPHFEQWGQEQFWGLNAFFKQTDVIRHMMTDDDGRRRVSHLELVSNEVGGPTHYEDRAGVAKVALPEFDGQEIDPGAQTNRRAELARLLTGSDNSQLAAAFVNRLWSHFFGYGFTNPVDDMGPPPPAHASRTAGCFE